MQSTSSYQVYGRDHNICRKFSLLTSRPRRLSSRLLSIWHDLIYVIHRPRYNDFICNSATSSRPHIDATIQGNGSLVLSNFLVVSLKQQQTEWHVFARFLSSATIKTINRLSWELLSHMKTVSFVNFVTLAVAMFLCVVHDNYAPIIRDVPFGEIKCFDDKQSIMSYHMNEHQW